MTSNKLNLNCQFGIASYLLPKVFIYSAQCRSFTPNKFHPLANLYQEEENKEKNCYLLTVEFKSKRQNLHFVSKAPAALTKEDIPNPQLLEVVQEMLEV